MVLNLFLPVNFFPPLFTLQLLAEIANRADWKKWGKPHFSLQIAYLIWLWDISSKCYYSVILENIVLKMLCFRLQEYHCIRDATEITNPFLDKLSELSKFQRCANKVTWTVLASTDLSQIKFSGFWMHTCLYSCLYMQKRKEPFWKTTASEPVVSEHLLKLIIM